jgi:hypothetical protein
MNYFNSQNEKSRIMSTRTLGTMGIFIINFTKLRMLIMILLRDYVLRRNSIKCVTQFFRRVESICKNAIKNIKIILLLIGRLLRLVLIIFY